ncbi:MAG TPA: 3-hydroxyacyl-CoA dehydrogenase family protein [Methylomirabilota bacterium]|jgi:3-hydroxybutyryl-CoA dehydrogenase|nr:3-hydroxyacyl-CoA dehydrogenase family protein [Methylomirabilota bacterium]
MTIETIGVIGYGQMGKGIARLAAHGGFPVTVCTRKAIENSASPKNIAFTTSYNELAEVDIVLEAITESLEAKQEIFKKLDAVCKPETIFASGTSSLSITDMMAVVSAERQKRFIGAHFFHPVLTMKLVEVITTAQTDSEIYQPVLELIKKLKKVAIGAGDRPGFIVNRLLLVYLLNAIRLLEEGLASMADIDAAMTLGCGHPMGPFALSDVIGLDVLLQAAQNVFKQTRDTRFAPPPLLQRMVALGCYGRKAGKGFYSYAHGRKNSVSSS